MARNSCSSIDINTIGRNPEQPEIREKIVPGNESLQVSYFVVSELDSWRPQ
jgi:hypothetical protein